VIRRGSLLLLVLTVMVSLTTLAAGGDETKNLVVMIDHNPRGFSYTIDGKESGPDFLTYLNEHGSAWPAPQTKVVLLVHERASLAMVNNSRGMIIKAGYEPPRVFQFSNDKRGMIELTFLPAIPFSVRGPR